MKKLLLYFILTYITTNSFSQDSVLNISLIQTIKGDYIDFTTDNLGNIYLLTATNHLKKINSKGDSIAAYNDVRRFGKIYSVDATNPLKVLIYFKDFITVTVLDRLLNVRNTIDLKQQNIYQATAVTTSYDNNIWIYDELESKLKKIDDNGRIVFESTDLRQVFDSVPSPSNLYDRDGQLYLYDPKKGLYVFDYYGGKKNYFMLKNYSNFQVIDKNTFTATDSSHVLLYQPLTLQTFSFSAFKNQDNYKKIFFNTNNIYCLNKLGQLEIYSVSKN